MYIAKSFYSKEIYKKKVYLQKCKTVPATSIKANVSLIARPAIIQKDVRIQIMMHTAV